MRRDSAVIVAGAVAAFAASVAVFAWLPAATLSSAALQMALYMAVIAAAYRLMPYRDRAGWAVMGIAWIAAAALASANCWYFTRGLGGTLTEPVLLNADELHYYCIAELPLDESSRIADLYRLPWAVTMLLFGKNIVTATLVCLFSGVLSLVFIGYLSATATGRQKASTIAIAMAAAMAYMMAVWTVPLKDSFILLGMSMMAAAMTRLLLSSQPLLREFVSQETQENQENNFLVFKNFLVKKVTLFALFALGLALVCIMRFAYAAFILIGIVILGWRPSGMQDAAQRARRWGRVAVLFSILAIFSGEYIWFQNDTKKNLIYERLLHKDRYGGRFDYIDDYAQTEDNPHAGYNRYVAWYHSRPLPVKLLLTPANAAVQWIIPLPWTAANDLRYGPAMAYAHQGWVWYAVGFFILCYILLPGSRRGSPRALKMLTLWGALVWFVPPFMTGGLVSRYGLTLLPMLLPAASWAWMNRRDTPHIKRWGAAYAAIIAAALAAAYYLTRL